MNGFDTDVLAVGAASTTLLALIASNPAHHPHAASDPRREAAPVPVG